MGLVLAVSQRLFLAGREFGIEMILFISYSQGEREKQIKLDDDTSNVKFSFCYFFPRLSPPPLFPHRARKIEYAENIIAIKFN